MDDVVTSNVVRLLKDIQESQSKFHDQNIKRQDRLEDALSKLVENQSILTVAIAKIEEQQESHRKRHDEQKEIDTLQDHKLEILKDDYHTLDKRLGTAERQLDQIEKTLDAVEQRTSELSTQQTQDQSNWGVLSFFSTKVLVPLFLSVCTFVGSVLWMSK